MAALTIAYQNQGSWNEIFEGQDHDTISQAWITLFAVVIMISSTIIQRDTGTVCWSKKPEQSTSPSNEQHKQLFKTQSVVH